MTQHHHHSLCGIIDITVDMDEQIVAAGREDLHEKGKYLNTGYMINILSLDDITTISHGSIPVGLKENKFFVFDNTDNIRCHRENKKSRF